MKLSLCFEGYVTAEIKDVFEPSIGNYIEITEENLDEIEDGLYDGTYLIRSLSEMIDDGNASFDLHDFEFVS